MLPQNETERHFRILRQLSFCYGKNSHYYAVVKDEEVKFCITIYAVCRMDVWLEESEDTCYDKNRKR